MTALTGDQTVQLVDAYRQAGIDVSGLTGVNPFTEELSVGVAYRLEQLRAVNPKLYTELRDAAGKAPAPSLALLHAQEIQARGGAGVNEWGKELQQEWAALHPAEASEQKAAREQQLFQQWEQAAAAKREQRLRPGPNPAHAEELQASRMRATADARRRAHASGLDPLTGLRRSS